MSKKIAVIYHGDCWDGFSGGYAAWKKFGKRAEYFPMKHHEPIPKDLKNKDIYIVDFAFKEPIMKKLVAANKKVVALDHHISAEKATRMAHEYVYALDHSGAVIAWRYFHPHKPIPRLLRHVEDIDIWKFAIPHTKELMAYMGTVDFDLKAWDRLAREWENPKKYREYIKRGADILRYEDRMVRRLLEGAELAKFEGYKTLVVNSPVLHSEIGHRLSKKLPPIAIVWSEKDHVIKVSLRSDGKADVSQIAQKYGGGGHKAAAAFTFPVGKKAPWKLL